MLEYELYISCIGQTFVVPSHNSFRSDKNVVINNVPGKHLIVSYERDDDNRPIVGSDEIIFASDSYKKCRAKLNKLMTSGKNTNYYYMPTLRKVA